MACDADWRRCRLCRWGRLNQRLQGDLRPLDAASTYLRHRLRCRLEAVPALPVGPSKRTVASDLRPLDAASTYVRRGIPTADAGDLDDVAGVGRMNERAAADVDADMPEAIEEDEVAGLELVTRDRAAHAVLRVRAVRKRDADLREHVHHQPRAIEPRRRGATPYVWGAEIVL